MQAKQGSTATLTCPAWYFQLEDGFLRSPQPGNTGILCVVTLPAALTSHSNLEESGDGDGKELTAISSFDTDLPKLPF
jgi:hypothetical protein